MINNRSGRVPGKKKAEPGIRTLPFTKGGYIIK